MERRSMRTAAVILLAFAAACGGREEPEDEPVPQEPLTVAGRWTGMLDRAETVRFVLSADPAGTGAYLGDMLIDQGPIPFDRHPLYVAPGTVQLCLDPTPATLAGRPPILGGGCSAFLIAPTFAGGFWSGTLRWADGRPDQTFAARLGLVAP